MLDPDELYRHVKSVITDNNDYYILLDEINFSEFYSAYGGDFNNAWLMFCNYGGMPLCLSMQTQEDKATYLTNLFATTLQISSTATICAAM